MGKRQGLNNGVMGNPPSDNVGPRMSRSLDFFSAIDAGENPRGQTTIAPAEVVRAGKCDGYRAYRGGDDTKGDRWGRDPVLK